MGKIFYRRTESVSIVLNEDDVIAAIRSYLSNRIDIPEGAEFDWELSSAPLFKGVTIRWTESLEPTEEPTG